MTSFMWKLVVFTVFLASGSLGSHLQVRPQRRQTPSVGSHQAPPRVYGRSDDFRSMELSSSEDHSAERFKEARQDGYAALDFQEHLHTHAGSNRHSGVSEGWLVDDDMTHFKSLCHIITANNLAFIYPSCIIDSSNYAKVK